MAGHCREERFDVRGRGLGVCAAAQHAVKLAGFDLALIRIVQEGPVAAVDAQRDDIHAQLLLQCRIQVSRGVGHHNIILFHRSYLPEFFT